MRCSSRTLQLNRRSRSHSWSVVRAGPPAEEELEVLGKVGAAVRIWLRRRLSLKVRAELYSVYVFLLILHRLFVPPLCEGRSKAIEQLLFSLLWGGCKPNVRVRVMMRWECNTWSVINTLRGSFSYEYWQGIRSGRGVLGPLSLALPSLCSGVDCRRKPPKQSKFFHDCWTALLTTPRSSDISRHRKPLYWELVEGVASDPLCGQLSLSAIVVNE